MKQKFKPGQRVRQMSRNWTIPFGAVVTISSYRGSENCYAIEEWREYPQNTFRKDRSDYGYALEGVLVEEPQVDEEYEAMLI